MKLYNLDYEFNSLTRLDKGVLTKPTPGLKHEAKEKAAREYYLQNESKRYAEQIKDKYKMFDDVTEKNVEKFRNDMDNIGDEMEEEWKKLFTNLTEFKAKVNV